MDSTFEMKSHDIARLLVIGRDDPEKDAAPDEASAHLLRDLLARRVSLDVNRADSFPSVLGRPCDDVAGHADRTLADVLFDPQADLAALTALKDYGKNLVRGAWSDAERAAATTLYYGAIAAALVVHRQRITQHSVEKLDDGLAELDAKPWMPAEFVELFRKARSSR